MNIILYKKTGCPWAQEVEEYLKVRGLPFDARDILENEAYKTEVEEKSGQSKSPTLDIDGTILTDAGVEDVERHLDSMGVKA